MRKRTECHRPQHEIAVAEATKPHARHFNARPILVIVAVVFALLGVLAVALWDHHKIALFNDYRAEVERRPGVKLRLRRNHPCAGHAHRGSRRKPVSLTCGDAGWIASAWPDSNSDSGCPARAVVIPGSRIVAGQRLGDVHDCPALTAGAHEFCDQLCDHSREHSPVPQVSEGAASCGIAAHRPRCGTVSKLQRLAAALAAATAPLLASTALRTWPRGTPAIESWSRNRSSAAILAGRPCRRLDQASPPAANASIAMP